MGSWRAFPLVVVLVSGLGTTTFGERQAAPKVAAQLLIGVWDLVVRVEHRARRYAAVLERMIAPDGSFPPIGRSLAYRERRTVAMTSPTRRRFLMSGQFR
jgi:hypothetical protein